MPESQPNIILITTDQQRFDTVGRAAPPWMNNPNYMHLCYEGVEFTRAYSDCPLCVPARVTIMTGQAADRHGMLANGHTHEVMDEDNTLPACLKQVGYHTAAIGKMHFHPMRKRHGFDEMLLPQDYFNEMRRSGYPCAPMASGLTQTDLNPGMSTVPEALTLTHWIADQSAHYIRERRDPTHPFFLWTSFSKPHQPFDPPEPYYSMYLDAPIPEPVCGDWSEGDAVPAAFRRTQVAQGYDLLSKEVLRKARAAYLGMITQIDYNMGRIFEALRDTGQWENTVILFTSDHGEYLGDHYAAQKCYFHEPSAHVPFVLRLPRPWERRVNWVENRSPVTLADVMPTILDVAGSEPPEGIDGRSLMPIARGETEKVGDFAFARGPVTREYLAATDGRFKYIWYPEGEVVQGFDLQEDPKELKNLAADDRLSPGLERLRKAVIEHYGARGCDWIRDGELVGFEPQQVSEAELRDRNHDTFMGEFFDKDTRH